MKFTFKTIKISHRALKSSVPVVCDINELTSARVFLSKFSMINLCRLYQTFLRLKYNAPFQETSPNVSWSSKLRSEQADWGNNTVAWYNKFDYSCYLYYIFSVAIYGRYLIVSRIIFFGLSSTTDRINSNSDPHGRIVLTKRKPRMFLNVVSKLSIEL